MSREWASGAVEGIAQNYFSRLNWLKMVGEEPMHENTLAILIVPFQIVGGVLFAFAGCHVAVRLFSATKPAQTVTFGRV